MDHRHTRWFRRLLKLLPADFQADYARDMERTFAAQHRDASRRGGASTVAALWWETLRDLLRTAPREHASQVAQDARYALRMVRLAPGFSAVAVLTLALGIGATTAMFSVVHAVLLRPLPFSDPDRIVRVFETRVRDGLFRNAASGPNVLDWQEQSTSFEQIAAYRWRSLNVSGTGEPRYVTGARATASFFSTLGVAPARGRTFSVTEDGADARVAVVTDDFWRSQLGGDPDAVGRSIDLDGEPFLVIGVLPAAFRFPLDAGVWIPLGLYPGTAASRGSHNLQVIARLKRDRTIDEARAELEAVAARLEEEYPSTNIGWSVYITSLHDSAVEGARPLTLVLLGTVGFVLLVACANIGSMLVARAAGRTREFTVRIALGADRARLVRQLLTESVILAGAGGAVGVALAWTLVEGVRRFDALPLPRLEQAALDLPVLAMSLGATVLTGLLFGVAPALHVARWEFGGGLRGAQRSGSAGIERRRLQAALNVTQTAVAILLLSGAGLMIRTLGHLGRVDAGFDPRGILAADLSLAGARYPDNADAARFFERVTIALRALPGVTESAIISDPPFIGGVGHWENGFAIVGRPPKPPGEMDFAYLRWITPGYFRAIGVPLHAGRELSDDDVGGRPLVLVVNAAFAERFFPGEDPLGREVVLGWRQPVPRRIVGVVGNLRETALNLAPEPQMYLPYFQAPAGYGTLLVKTAGEPEALVDGLRDAIRGVDPQQPLFNVRPLAADVDAWLAPRRVAMEALALFAALALGLASIGIYAVVSYQVRERTREFGVRMAMGARGVNIVTMVVRQGVAPAVAGVVAGVAAAAALSRVLEGLLFGVGALDPVTFGATPAFVLAVAVLACIAPARRAASTDPSAALRSE